MCLGGIGIDLHHETQGKRDFQRLETNSCRAWGEEKKGLVRVPDRVLGGKITRNEDNRGAGGWGWIWGRLV
jgi:hypothetical protein